jgi:hypothetical protein
LTEQEVREIFEDAMNEAKTDKDRAVIAMTLCSCTGAVLEGKGKEFTDMVTAFSVQQLVQLQANRN